jgi:hypothetical protein
MFDRWPALVHEAPAALAVDHAQKLKEESKEEGADDEADNDLPVRDKTPAGSEALNANAAVQNGADNVVEHLGEQFRERHPKGVEQHEPLQVHANDCPRRDGTPVARPLNPEVGV